ncbi:MAG: fatty acid desaturase [Thermoanaerobaculia bacterium]|nr:fatty acid desaturase [Thermoanaerobaculia bacterium]
MDARSQVAAAKYWNRLLAPYAEADDAKAWIQLLTTTTLFVGTWLAMLWSLQISYWLTLGLAIPAAGLQIRLFIFQHDCGHGSFFRSSRWNDTVGGLIGILMLTPYRYWRRTHAIHHASSGDLDRRDFGDVETLTVKEYLALPRHRRIAYRLYRNPLILFVLGPIYQFVLKHRLPLDIPRNWRRERRSVAKTNLALLGLLLVAWPTIGIDSLLLVQLPITLLSGSVGMWLFYVQHQFEDTYWRHNPEWSFHRAGLQGSSFYDLPAVLHWFTGNIGFHHVHHLASRIPNYRLKQCFRNVPELGQVTRLTILGSLRCARLHLWNEAEKRLVGFSHLRRLQSA